MTPHEGEMESDVGDDTLPAAADVVAQIRAHAAKARLATAEPAPADDGARIEPWTAEAPVAEPRATEPRTSETRVAEPRISETRVAEPWVAEPWVTEPAPPARPRSIESATEHAQGSLIDGIAPPVSSTSFWNDERLIRASGVDAKPRFGRVGALSLSFWIVMVVLLILITSVGIAFAVATIEPVS